MGLAMDYNLGRMLNHSHDVDTNALYLLKRGDSATGNILLINSTVQGNNLIASINAGTTQISQIITLPDQATHAGQSLTTNGSVASWSLPGFGNVVYKTSTYTLQPSDRVCLADGSFDVLLPTAVGIAGKFYTITNVGTGIISVKAYYVAGTPPVHEAIDGCPEVDLPIRYQSIEIVSDGTAWYITANYLGATPVPFGYSSQYPPAQNNTYVKATSWATNMCPWYATDPTKSVTGDWGYNSWLDGVEVLAPQRFSIDLGVAKVINRIYLENGHTVGAYVTYGIQHFIFQGSNSSAAFDDVLYADDTGWTTLPTDIPAWAQHVMADVSDPQYALVTNSTPYRYYSIKASDNYGGPGMDFRRIELQVLL